MKKACIFLLTISLLFATGCGSKDSSQESFGLPVSEDSMPTQETHLDEEFNSSGTEYDKEICEIAKQQFEEQEYAAAQEQMKQEAMSAMQEYLEDSARETFEQEIRVGQNNPAPLE